MLLCLMCLILSIYVVLMSSPQMIVMTLVFQTFVISLLLGFLNSVWYSYILFLVFLGGMLVVFIYISSLASSIKMSTHLMKFLKISFTSLTLVFTVIYSCSSWLLLNMNHFFYNEHKIIYVFSSNNVYYLYIFVVGYLLLALWVVCMLVKMLSGPLRKLM